MLRRTWIVIALGALAALVAVSCKSKPEETPKPSPSATQSLAGKIAGQAKSAVGKVESARAKQSQVGDEE